MTENNSNQPNQDAPIFRMQKMYLKDLSFENPNAPDVFMTPQTSPKVDLNLEIKHRKLDDENWEVTMSITAKVRDEKEGDPKILFIIEIEHAAIFTLKNIPEEHVKTVLSVDCPTLMFPFTRQIMSQLSVDGGFMPFLMDPVNFMALYQGAKKNNEGEVKQ
ncbi:MAG: protein-export chaperone SecB [Proteobacteria bacterium]|nr:protein-export chaperone SecB [Pseudomonadota bacterium]MBU1715560.1 protein-export chaperone SecB [Pseudomonadota bacterium]